MTFEDIKVDPRLVSEPSDDLRHALRPHSAARESIPYMLVLPEERITAFVYTWVGPDNKGGAACCIYGPGVGPEPIFEKLDGLDVPEGADFTDWKVGDIHLRQTSPLKTAEVVYTGKRVSFEMHFEAYHPAYSYDGHPEGCPPAFADNRFEQSGLVKGVLTIDGRRIPYNTTGHRDHSWGAREWKAIQHWKWFQGQSGPDLSAHFLEILVAGRRYVRGYIYQDGKMAEVTDIDFQFEHDDTLEPLTMNAVLHDDIGRQLQISGTKVATYPFLIAPTTLNTQSGMSLEFDGKPGVGWLELSWPKAYIDYMSTREKYPSASEG